MDEENVRIDRCPTCKGTQYRYISEDVVQCDNCTYLWVRPPGDDDETPGAGGRPASDV